MSKEQARRVVTADGTAIAYRVLRARIESARPPVVLLHGLASNLTRFSEFVEQTSLSQQHELIRIDLRGHGDSPARGPIALESFGEDLATVLDHAGHSRAILVGHSLGAQVALAFAARFPERTAALVLIDPVFRQALHGRWRLLAQLGPLFAVAAGAARRLNALGLRRKSLEPLDLRALDELARASLGSPQAEAEFIRRYSSMRADLRSVRTAHYLQELVEMFRPIAAPQGFAMPVLVLLSTGATFGELAVMRAIAARFPRGEVRTIDCHHWPLTEKPDEVRRLIEDWCARLAL